MKKAIAWILGLTKVGKVVTTAQNKVSGYKSYLAGLALAVPALITIISNFGDQGSAYLIGVTNTPEWQALMAGFGIMGLRAAVSKSEVGKASLNQG